MHKKLTLSIIFVVASMILFAFSPWITKDIAEKRALTGFQNQQKDIVDGCGFNCVGCGVVTSEKVLFGYIVRIEYACGLISEDIRENHQKKNVFVSFLGTAH
ncbi:hypothetical protein SAMN05518871_11192 [Psychrobacillus sp. OK028]|uniref:hypothetical protein n=1 Tax=Psychrobacillus sp. OK028 TaxID=1884359 RepID=UPI00088A64F8|nr:hypothetical protein [Psychrobacillus sp. OK028]SDO17476.1 hypothetical protein SAMN05518871_11192 [Psychrobacillus sp. OK028]